MNKPNVFLVIGKSFSGKDTLVNTIIRDKEFCESANVERLVRCTTRAMRPGEEEGKEYFYISDKYYEKHYRNNPNAVTTSFNSKFGFLHYITDFSKLDPDKNYITTGDPDMIKPFKEKLGKNHLCVIYLVTPNWVLMQRWTNRGDNEKYNDKKYQEICRRFMDELVLYGAHSNEFLANTNSIINLSNGFYLPEIKEEMIRFIKGPKKSIILSNTKMVYNNDYFPRYDYDHCDRAMYKGEISICNGNIILNSEDSTFTGYSRLA